LEDKLVEDDNIKRGEKTGYEAVDWFQLVQHTDQWLSNEDCVMTIWEA